MEENNKKSREIDLIAMLRKAIHDWKIISLFVLVFGILGVLSVLTSTKMYKTDVVLAPETSGSELSNMMDAWGNLIGKSFGGGSSSDAIYPELYPNIFTSTTFLIDLYDVPVVLKDGSKTQTYYNHLKNDYKPSLSSYPKIWLAKFIMLFKKEEVSTGGLNPFHLTKEQYNICKLMRRNIQCVVDQRTNLITVSVIDIDNVIAATMADTVTARLQEYIIDYRTRKARHDLEFITEMYNQAQKEYYDIQTEYAKFADANMNVVKASQRARLENLENEMQLKSNLYASVSQQLQIARQRLQERTPAFMTIQPAVVSIEHTGMSGFTKLLIFCFLGFALGAAWSIYLKDMYKSFIANRKKKK